MLEEENVQLKVRISRDVSRRLKQYVSSKHPDLLRGPLSEEVEKAIIQYLDSKEKVVIVEHTHARIEVQQQQMQENQQQQSNNNTKYKKLIETIKRYSNSQTRQISSGLAKKAIRETIGKDDRTIDKYLKILQDDDILYGNSILGVYDVQSWVFGEQSHSLVTKQEQQTSSPYSRNP